LGTVTRHEIARRVGVSKAAVNRYLREVGLRKRSDQYAPEVVAAVTSAYEAGGKAQVHELFPHASVRSIVERYPHAPRQIRWTAEQLIEAAKMAGLVSHTGQARYFGRPNAYAGSIASVWAKTFQCAEGDINGLGVHLTWRLVRPGTPAVLVHQRTLPGPRTLVLWLDLTAHLRAEVAPAIRQAIVALARFQAWLHGTDDPAAIRRMIQEREGRYGDQSG